MTPNDEIIFDLLEQWEDTRAAGLTPSVEELCRDRPDLVPMLWAKIDALAASDWMRSPASAAGPRVLAGRYRLEQLAGAGGYGQVWRAFDQELERRVAVKVPIPSRWSGGQQIDQSLTEARRVARLRHPGIVTVHDVVKEGAGYAIVADWVEGEDLADRLRRGPLPTAEAVAVVSQVALALDYAHGQGVVHRDIKPSNILLGRDGVVRVCDFGIAATPAELARGTDRRGTVAYASPEQLGDGPVDHRTDFWSLGVVLVEALTGRQPTDTDAPSFPLTGVPTRLIAVCEWCLSPSSADRPASGRELATALARASARRVSLGWWSRWLVGAACGLLALVAVVALGGKPDAPLTTNSAPASEEQRSVAEQVVRAGGSIWFNGNVDPVTAPTDIPTGPVRLDAAAFPRGKPVSGELLGRLARSPALAGLTLSGTRIGDDDLAVLRGMAGLRSLRLGGTALTDAGIAHFAGLTRLEFLELTGVPIGDDSLESVHRIEGLASLNLSETRVTDAGLARWPLPPGLRTLRLNQTAATDTGLTHVAGLSALDWLELRGTRVTDAGMGSISRLGRQTKLDISSTGVTDRGLIGWDAPDGMKVLRLNGLTGVTDAGLEPLRHLTRLTTVEMRGTRTSTAGVARLREKLPGCTVTR
ncbi:MAG: protein kinase [Bacteroidales bacterium]|nr:protein kinase [Bacteroidales bacterium]